MAVIPLEKAGWCENCQAVVDTFTTCPTCATYIQVPLALWLNRSSATAEKIQLLNAGVISAEEAHPEACRCVGFDHHFDCSKHPSNRERR